VAIGGYATLQNFQRGYSAMIKSQEQTQDFILTEGTGFILRQTSISGYGRASGSIMFTIEDAPATGTTAKGFVFV
jgi:hypothetical protein